MEFEAPGIIVAVAPYGEGDALASVFTEPYGVYRGLARGGLSKRQASLWQIGNLAQARWVARLADQLGSYTAELIHPGAALAMDDPWALSVLTSACATAERALPEREPHPRIFRALLHLVVHGAQGMALLPDLIRWEAGLLEELGYGLDLSRCAVTGTRDNLAYISPRTGRAVNADAAGLWRERLLPLPALLTDPGVSGGMEDWAAGLRVTGHFLARDVFGTRHQGMPPARIALEDRLRARLSEPGLAP